jgi:hypothetical protein
MLGRRAPREQRVNSDLFLKCNNDPAAETHQNIGLELPSFNFPPQFNALAITSVILSRK